jgi:hypothetical protein
LQLHQSVETFSKILLELKNVQICHLPLIVLTKINNFWQKLIRNVQPKNSLSALKIFVQFFSRLLAFFRNYNFIVAYSVFRWCFATCICIWETRERLKIFKYTLNRNEAELFEISLRDHSTLTQLHLKYMYLSKF